MQVAIFQTSQLLIEGHVYLKGKEINIRSPIQAREAEIETVYQTLAMSPALSIGQ